MIVVTQWRAAARCKRPWFVTGVLVFASAACDDSSSAGTHHRSKTPDAGVDAAPDRMGGGGAHVGEEGGKAGTGTGGNGAMPVPEGGTKDAGATDAGAGAGGVCKNSLDCLRVTDGRTICARDIGLCVECVTADDCPPSHDCSRNRCVEFTSCRNSLDCAKGQVCDPGVKRCFECVMDADCSAGEACSDHACRPSCRSDKDCTPLGLLCDLTHSACVNCATDDHCKSEEFCSAGNCVPDVCDAGSSRCTGDSVVSCNDRGDAFNAATPCGARQTCVETGAHAACEDWICTPDAVE